jgi:hypothetical protein
MTYKPGGTNFFTKAKEEKAKYKTVGIHCPTCDWKQTVDTECWVFQCLEGHGYTCGSGKCPSHTYLVIDDNELCDIRRKL